MRRSVLVRPSHLLAFLSCVMSSACWQSQESEPPNTLELTYSGVGAYRDPRLLHVVLDEGPNGRHLSGGEFTTTRYLTPHSQMLEVPSTGLLPLRVLLVSLSGDTLASARIALPLRPAHRYGLSVRAGGPRPEGICVGKITAVPIVRGDVATETLFVSTAGLPRDAMC